MRDDQRANASSAQQTVDQPQVLDLVMSQLQGTPAIGPSALHASHVSTT